MSSAYAGLQYAYAISTGRSGARTLHSSQVCRTSALACGARVLFCGQILFHAARMRDAGHGAQLAVWEVGYASAGERTLSGSTPALHSAAPLRSLRHSRAPTTSPAEPVKAEKGEFRKRESEIYIFTFVMKFDDLA